MENTIPQNSVEQEIDLIEIVRKLWCKRKFIIKVTIIFAILGILVALFSAKIYTAQCTIVPQTGGKSTGGSLGGLAAMAGINLGGMESGELLSPKIYSKILNSVPFQKDLMQIHVRFQEFDEPIRLIDYYTDEKYQKFSLFGAIKKYTIGLPGVIMGALKEEEDPQTSLKIDSMSNIETLTKEEYACIKAMNGVYALDLNEKEGYFTLSVNMSEPLAAAQLASGMQVLLQKYVTTFKIEKVKNNLEFVESSYRKAKEEFEDKQQELATYRDANQNVTMKIANITEERLKTQSDLLFNVYSELAKQREQAKIQVKETTPIFTVVDPITVPKERSKPKRGMICIAFTFLGIFVGVGLALVLPFLAQLSGSKYLSQWSKD